MKTLIAVPCMDEIDVGFVQSLMDLKTVGETKIQFLSGSLIYEARERLAAMAIDNDFDHVLWLDSDQMFKPTMMIDFVASDKDIVTGVIPSRRPPFIPLIYRKEDNKLVPVAGFGDHLLEVDGCGFGAVLMKTEVLEKCFDKYKTCFMPVYGFGEDLSFCIRAKELGYKIYADPRIEIGHIGKTVITKDFYRRENARESKAGVKDHD